MVKTTYNYLDPLVHPNNPVIPKPPKLPDYKPDKTYWSYSRVRSGITNLDGTENWSALGDIPKDDDKPDWRGVIRKNVIELPMPGKYGFGQRQDTNYFFFDTPDYADPFKKLWWANKFFFKTGVILWTLRGLLEGAEFTWKNNLRIIGKTLKPWYAGGMVGTLAVLTISNLRGKKDDYYNYALAGLLAGSYVGRENHVKWFRSTLFWPPAALMVKYVAETNGILLPHDNAGRSSNLSLSGNSADHGILSGDLRPQALVSRRDPGRDQRTIAI